jgi:hypothetical protein
MDIIFLQETMRQDFTDQELRSLVSGDLFHWHWRAAVGRSGGMLLGICDDSFEVGAIDQGNFFLSASLFHRETKFKFEFIVFMGQQIILDLINSLLTWNVKLLPASS